MAQRLDYRMKVSIDLFNHPFYKCSWVPKFLRSSVGPRDRKKIHAFPKTYKSFLLGLFPGYGHGLVRKITYSLIPT